MRLLEQALVTARMSRRTGLKSHAQRLPASAGVKIFEREKTDAAPNSACAW
ncbi:hypothetical protein XMIN_3379 [Xanthomonas citri pv. mangiferaeindicae LMG 941]|nr:hypothetical protein XMIN_3379 [Xanthomonas citri pv. mangiferaeindicae LMG 941]